MIDLINDLPDQLRDAWTHGKSQKMAWRAGDISRVVICGMGGSAISGDMLAALVEDNCPTPIMVVRDYILPAWANGASTLVVCLSHSGSTEETLSCARLAIQQGAKLLAITTGGELARLTSEYANGVVWDYQYDAMPRAATGWLYGMLLSAFSRIGLAGDLEADVQEAITAMEKYREQWRPEVMAAKNPPKRYAGQLVDCIPVIWGSGILAPVARRWKTQINENSKSPAYFELFPELNHNTVVGIDHPQEMLRRHKFQIIQLYSQRYDHPRNLLRHQATTEIFREQAIITDSVKARGESKLAQQMTTVQFGDYVSYYLAMAYEVDPTPIGPIVMLKDMMAKAE
jgi:glucose/mannose-6-phosphate isomerase